MGQNVKDFSLLKQQSNWMLQQCRIKIYKSGKSMAIVDTMKCTPEAECFFSLLQKLYVFVSASYSLCVKGG